MANEIRIRRTGRAGRITLNRPRALNTLTRAMVEAMTEALAEWRAASAIDLVVIDAAGNRAFCAGGDLGELHPSLAAGDLGACRAHCRAEYRLDMAIASYPKPVVAILNGATMGGGIGLSCLASHPVATEHTRIATPECAVGFVPDSGATWLLAKMPEPLGEYLALTGRTIAAGDAIACGFARHFVPENRLVALVHALEEDGDAGAISSFATPAPAGALIASFRSDSAADAAFGAEDVPQIMARLRTAANAGSRFAADALRAMERASPLSLAASLLLVRKAREAVSLREAIRAEYRAACACMSEGDLAEGIRARMIDRDGQPRWRFAEPEGVPKHVIERFFAIPPEGDLELP